MNLHNDLAALIITFGAERVKQEVDIVSSRLLRQVSAPPELAQATPTSIKPVAAKAAKKAVAAKAEKAPAKKAAKRTLSPEARARIVEAQKKRWAKFSGESADAKPAKRKAAPKSALTPVAPPPQEAEPSNDFSPEPITLPVIDEQAPAFLEN